MSHRFVGLALLLGLVLVLPAFADDSSTKKPAKDDKTKHIDSDVLTPGAYTGKLLSVPDNNAGVSVQIDAMHVEPKSKKGGQAATAIAKEEAKVAQLEAELASPKSAKDYASKTKQLESALSQLQRAMAKAAADTKTVTEQKTVDFQLASDVKVRRINLPPRFDDQGVVKPYTDEEKKALQGSDTKLPGYEAKLSDLQVGDLLRITMGRKPTPKTTDSAQESDANKDKTPVEKKTEVTIVVILNDNDANKDKDQPKDKATPPKK